MQALICLLVRVSWNVLYEIKGGAKVKLTVFERYRLCRQVCLADIPRKVSLDVCSEEFSHLKGLLGLLLHPRSSDRMSFE